MSGHCKMVVGLILNLTLPYLTLGLHLPYYPSLCFFKKEELVQSLTVLSKSGPLPNSVIPPSGRSKRNATRANHLWTSALSWILCSSPTTMPEWNHLIALHHPFRTKQKCTITHREGATQARPSTDQLRWWWWWDEDNAYWLTTTETHITLTNRFVTETAV